MLGVLKAGAAFLLLDRYAPPVRLKYLIEDSSATLLVTQGDLRVLLPEYFGPLIDIAGAIPAFDDRVRVLGVGSDDLAYIMYTSGSTGKPKGVLLNHRGLVNYLLWLREIFQLAFTDTVLQLVPVTFDPVVREVFAPLISRARLLMLEENDSKSAETILTTIRQQQVTCILAIVPTMLRALIRATRPGTLVSSLRLILVSGEKFLISDYQNAVQAFGERVQMVNQYGPTECTLIAAYHQITKVPLGTSVPIGKPIPNVELLVLDATGAMVPCGMTGEIYIGGVGLARGYLNAPELTRAKFIFHPSNPEKRLYRTGDLARYLPEGNLEFVGRLDNQVKIRGNRVELEEVEAALAQFSGISDAAVAAQPGPDGEMRLVAYAIPRPGATPSEQQLRSFAVEHLPQYMVPGRFVFVPEFPRTNSGKLDRGALATIAATTGRPMREYQAPRTTIERTLVDILAENLGVRPVGVDTNFFDLGGDSLLAVQILMQINRDFKMNLTVSELFDNPTVAALAEVIGRKTCSSRVKETTIET